MPNFDQLRSEEAQREQLRVEARESRNVAVRTAIGWVLFIVPVVVLVNLLIASPTITITTALLGFVVTVALSYRSLGVSLDAERKERQATQYEEYLRHDLGLLIDGLELPDLSKHLLRSRWLDQVLWAEVKANRARSYHYYLRSITI